MRTKIIVLIFIVFSFCGDREIDVLFCPEDFCAQRVVSEFRNAEKKIYVAMYRFTHTGILNVLKNEICPEIECFVILGKEKDNEDAYGELNKAKVPVKWAKSSGVMHNKFSVIDGRVVITGSFNFTYAADKENDENLLIISSQDIASLYEKEFIELWDAK